MARGCLQGVKYLMFAFNLLFWDIARATNIPKNKQDHGFLHWAAPCYPYHKYKLLQDLPVPECPGSSKELNIEPSAIS